MSAVVAHFQAYIWTRLLPDQPILAASLSVFIGVSVGALSGVIQGYIASAILGGASPLGGVGTIPGALTGANLRYSVFCSMLSTTMAST